MKRIYFTLILLLLIGFTQPSDAALRYADVNCPNNGSGTNTGGGVSPAICAPSGGAAGPYNNLQDLYTNCLAGDTCFIRTGTYLSTIKGDASEGDGGFHVENSGTSNGNRVTFMPYPGDTGVTIDRNCNYPGTAGDNCDGWQTITAYQQSYVTFDFRYRNLGGVITSGGILVHGGFWIKSDTDEFGNQVIGVECDEGGGEADGNWACIFFEGLAFGAGGGAVQQNDAYIAYTYTHNVIASWSGADSRSSGIKLYAVADSTIEYNTGIDISANSIDHKDNADNNLVQFNLSVNTGPIRTCYQAGCSGSEFKGNISVNGGGFLNAQTGASLNLHHNTVINAAFQCLSSEDTGPNTGALTWMDNICQNPGTHNILFEGAPSTDIGSADYNAYDSDKSYDTSNISNQTSLGGFISATGLDTPNSFEAAAPCAFATTNASETGVGYHVSGTACDNESSTGGELGAYGAPGSTGCVGWTCDDGGGGGDTTPPVVSGGAPSGVLSAGTTSTVMSVTTDESATCKYSTSDLNYASMATTFTTTGGTSHAHTLTPLSNGTAYTRYIRCQDVLGNPNTSSYTVNFSVAASTDVPASPKNFRSSMRRIQ